VKVRKDNAMATFRYSVIVVSRTQEEAATAIKSLSQLSGVLPSSMEILLALGSSPSKQRNAAAKEATGEYLIFLDNDSYADTKLLSKFEEALSSFEDVGVVGGPSICLEPKGLFKQAANFVLSSPMGLGPFRGRYFSRDKMRLTTERELILCNLLIRRNLFLESGGFRRDLYPNEENELLTRLRKRTKMVYHPEAICFREPRASYREFAMQFFWYGFGRAKHFVLMKPAWNVLFLCPSAFTLYNFSLLYCLLTNQATSPLLAPGVAYTVLILAETIVRSFKGKRLSLLLLLPILFWSCHFFYGLGFLVGMVRRPLRFMLRHKKHEEIIVRRISEFELKQIS
jgi:succinoglycan biosynthesis protein ExoA